MFHTVAYSQSITSSGTFQAINAVADPTVIVQASTQILVPKGFNQFWAAAPFAVANSAGTKAQLQSPSLRQVFFPTLTPRQVGATLDAFPHVHEQFDDPIAFAEAEGLQYFNDGGGDGVTARQTGAIVFLGDGPRKPTSGKIYTMRATTSITLVAATWTNGAFTFDQTLPVGNYDVVGMRAEGTGLLAARLVFVGPSAIVRPGCLGNASGTTLDLYDFRFGRIGVWGSFYSIVPPSVDCLGATGTSQVFEIDLIPR